MLLYRKQKREIISYLFYMPIIFTLMFYSFPSGLSLYWTTNQVMMIIQLAIMRHRHPPQISPAPAA